MTQEDIRDDQDFFKMSDSHQSPFPISSHSVQNIQIGVEKAQELSQTDSSVITKKTSATKTVEPNLDDSPYRS